GVLVVLLFIVGGLWTLGVAPATSDPAAQNPTRETPPTSPARAAPLSKSADAIHPSGADDPPESSVPIEPPTRSMSLKLKRPQRPGVTGKMIFALDARIGLNAEEHALVKKYKLGGFVVYDSTARSKHAEATKEHIEKSREHPSLFDGPGAQFFGLAKTL